MRGGFIETEHVSFDHVQEWNLCYRSIFEVVCGSVVLEEGYETRMEVQTIAKKYQ
jgi:hypothetical protein